MADAPYSKIEADYLIQVKKYVPRDARKYLDSRPTAHERSEKIAAFCYDDASLKFAIDLRFHKERDQFAITLEGQIGDGPMVGLRRYEIHDSGHTNPGWFDGLTVPGGTFHSHIYDERVYHQGLPWHACAKILDLPTALHWTQKQFIDLQHRFVSDLNIVIENGGSSQLFWKFTL